MALFVGPQWLTTGVLIILMVGVAKTVWERVRLQRDTAEIEEWLWLHTQDEPGESHRSISELARCLGMSLQRVNRAVDHSRAVFRSATQVVLVSVWGQEPWPQHQEPPALRSAPSIRLSYE